MTWQKVFWLDLYLHAYFFLSIDLRLDLESEKRIATWLQLKKTYLDPALAQTLQQYVHILLGG